MNISDQAPDRHGNPYYSDQKQVEYFAFYLDFYMGFDGTDRERGLVAEAWWMGDWSPKGRCPTLDEAKAFLATQQEAA